MMVGGGGGLVGVLEAEVVERWAWGKGGRGVELGELESANGRTIKTVGRPR
jgi:hypothetical protein